MATLVLTVDLDCFIGAGLSQAEAEAVVDEYIGGGVGIGALVKRELTLTAADIASTRPALTLIEGGRTA